MDEATFLENTKNTTKQYDVNCRQVSNGFALAGNTRYVNENGAVVVALQQEAVATDSAGAATAIAQFLTTGKFA
jgi:hypothetical protein